MPRKKTKVMLEKAIESLEANLAEERAGHDITRTERDGFKEKSESLEGHLDAAYEDLKAVIKRKSPVITVETASTPGVFAAALGGALTGAVMALAFMWFVIHFGL